MNSNNYGSEGFEDKGRIPSPGPVAATALDYAGRYTFYHDGWFGSLHLEHEGGRVLRGSYNSVRFQLRYDALAEVTEGHPTSIDLAFKNFDDNIADQRFVGCSVAAEGGAIAGRTTWKQIPFGFFAVRAGPLYLSRFGDGSPTVQPQDFEGRYTLWYGNWRSTIVLTYRGGHQLDGLCTFAPVAQGCPSLPG